MHPNDEDNGAPNDVSIVPGAHAERPLPRNRRDGQVFVHGIVVHPPNATDELDDRDSMRPLRVLIADDYVDAAESLAMLLSSAGVETEVAVEGERAMARASSWRPHICVLDIEMPGLDGNEIARRIREEAWASRPLLIALTGWTTAASRSGALEAGFDHYLVKPVEPTKLLRIIQTHLTKAHT